MESNLMTAWAKSWGKSWGASWGGVAVKNQGGSARANLEVMRKALREFEAEQDRIKARDNLPKIEEKQRIALKAAARKLAKSPEPFGLEDIEQQIKASMLQMQVEPMALHVDWMLYFLRVEAYHARQAAEEEEIAILLMLL